VGGELGDESGWEKLQMAKVRSTVEENSPSAVEEY
jgi:hypothetical protein